MLPGDLPSSPLTLYNPSMQDIAIVIPARWASVRFPGKPLHLLAGKPLVQHVWERCREARRVPRALIATDDERIAAAATGFGAEVILTSPDHPTGTDRLAEVARKLPDIRALINVQGDEPLVDPALIERLATELRQERALEMITAASPFGPADDPENPNQVKVVLDRAGNALYFSRAPIPHQRESGGFCAARYRHLGIYGYSSAFLHKFVTWQPTDLEMTERLEQLRALEYGTRIRVLLTEHFSLGVDTPEDARAAEKLLDRP